MSTVICRECGKPWMDNKHRQCPKCGTAPEFPPAGTQRSGPKENASDATAQTRLKLGAVAGPGAASDGITQAQAARIIALLEQRPPRRVDVANKASKASTVLDVLAVVILVVGSLVAVLGVVAMAEVGFVYGLVVLLSAAASTAINWGLLTTASVVAGYVANRSQ